MANLSLIHMCINILRPQMPVLLSTTIHAALVYPVHVWDISCQSLQCLSVSFSDDSEPLHAGDFLRFRWRPSKYIAAAVYSICLIRLLTCYFTVQVRLHNSTVTVVLKFIGSRVFVCRIRWTLWRTWPRMRCMVVRVTCWSEVAAWRKTSSPPSARPLKYASNSI